MTQSGPRPRSLVLASAGSGKTYRISSTIIGLLATGEAPGSIFASTFTRKAAGEILDRVLVRLARATLTESDAKELSKATSTVSGRAITLDQDGWAHVLHNTVESLHRLEIGTLDSFFLRALKAFGNDLGLPTRWSIVDEATAMRMGWEALEDVLRTLDVAGRVELVRGLAGGTARRSVHEALMRSLDSLASLHHAIDPEAPGWGALRAHFPSGTPPANSQFAEIADLIEAVEPPLTKAGTPVQSWSIALTRIAESIRTMDLPAILRETLFQRAIADTGEQFAGHDIPGQLRTLFTEVQRDITVIIGGRLANRAEALGRLAAYYSEALNRRIRETGSVRFIDVPRLLAGPHPTGARSDLRYRMDSSVEHILLDEFQDTSLEQWAALEPMMDAVVGTTANSSGAAAVVVADPKQSIYAWRGAAPIVVRAVGDRYALRADSLTMSWRSSQVLLDSVNLVFRALPEAKVLNAERGDVRTATAWALDFGDHQAASDLPGHVRVVAGPEAIRGSAADSVRFAVDQITDLKRTAPDSSIGILTRTNKMVAQIIHGLRENGVRASEEGGTRLMDSAGVTSVVALLRMADHPGDRISRYHVAHTAVGEVMSLTDATDLALARKVALDVRGLVMELGYGRMLAALVRRVTDRCLPRELRRLHQLVDFGYRYDSTRQSDRIADFVRAVQSERVEAPEGGGVRVMTIHGSKGLEFDAVVLPELNAPWFQAGESGPVGYRPSGIAPVTHAFPYIRREERALFPHFSELIGAHDQARSARLRDALGSLYVAMTRARHCLVMIVPAAGESGIRSGQSAAHLLRERLVTEEPTRMECEGDVLFESGNRAWARSPEGAESTEEAGSAERVGSADGAPKESVARADKAAAIHVALRTNQTRSRFLPQGRPSGLEGGGKRSISSLLHLDTHPAARARGTLVHNWLQNLVWIEDWDTKQPDLRTMGGEIALRFTDAELAREWEWLADRLRAAPIHGALSRSRYPSDVQVERELRFLLRTGDTMMEGSVDRVVVVIEEGVPVRAEVFDYKTDRIPSKRDTTSSPGENATWLDERLAFYSPQIEAYRESISAVLGIPHERVEAHLLFLDPGTLATVHPKLDR